jgi:type IV pilus assembly protein PilY1
MTPSKFNPLKHFFLLAYGLLGTAAVLAAPLTFQQVPAGAGAKEPAPNVIVSVDDSGSMGAAGMATLRQALTATFGVTAGLADNRIRMAWQSMNRCPSLGTSSTACGNYNGMRYFGGTHRANFDQWARTLVEGGGTPGHRMMANAGDYLMASISNNASPWAADPGVTLNPVLSCRKNFHIFMTDGGWNSGTTDTSQHIDTAGTNNGTRIVRGGGNADGTSKPLTASITYDISTSTPETLLYRDNWGGPTTNSAGNRTTLSTLSDLAFHYWSTDLQTGLTNNVRPSINRSSTETFVATNGSSTALPAFWNPRNNPATWQNMVNYTIGFNTAASWSGAPLWGGDTFSGGLANLINGVDSWTSPFCGPTNNAVANGNQPCDFSNGYTASGNAPVINGRRMDLWHAALNSRGLFVPAPTAQALVDAFQIILDDILVQTTKPLVSIATNSSRLSSGGFTYVAGYNSEGWSGELSGYQINATTSLPSKSPTWQATTLLDSTSTTVFSTATRVVLTHTGTQGTGFRWGNLSTAQQAALRGGTADTATVGEQRVSYLLGDRSREQRVAGGYMRNRESRLGDIVNSNIWYTGKPSRLGFEHTGHASFRSSNASRTPVVYVGANDGMLHGFNANTGRELVAYVPKAAYEHLRSYTLPTYSHRYFVDGHPFTGDADLGGTLNWRTVLVSGLGAGGKGYFILDVTNPNNFVDPGAAASPIVLMDTTDGAHPDIGHIFAAPVVDEQTRSRSQQIVKMNNNRWAVVMGNGYNSTNERPVLLIQYLDGDRSLKTIVTNATTGATNGLAAPQVIDVNGDGKVDIAYAGDLNGNLWKFNLTGAVDTSWSVGFSGSPLYTAVDAAGTPQAITVPPMYVAHPLGGIQLVFGTGRELTASDRSSTQVQTIYGIWDKSTYGSPTGPISSNDVERITGGRVSLVQQTQTGSVGSTGLLTTSSNPVVYSRLDTTAKRGWYFDLPVAGERVLGQPQVFEGQKALINSIVPKAAVFGESCNLEEAADRNFITILNAINGQPSKVPAFGTLDTSGSATRVEYGSGESITLANQKNNDTLVINTDYFCTGPSCAPCTGPACDVDDDGDGQCGGLSTGVLEICRAGLLGTRTDWRELR